MPSNSVRTSVVAFAEHIRHLPGSFFEFKVTALTVFWDMKFLFANGLLGLRILELIEKQGKIGLASFG